MDIATHGFLHDLTLVFSVAMLVTIVFQRLRQPVVLGYLLVGILIGPGVPTPLSVDPNRIETLSELGVILVMFSIGLEFSLQRLVRLLPTAGLAGLVQISAMLWLGFLVGRLFGWGWPGSLFVGGAVCISSTMIVARVLSRMNVESELSQSVFSILIIQDLAAIVLITVFTAVAGGAGLPAGEVVQTLAKLALFLVAVTVIGILLIPRLAREAYRHRSGETLLVTSVGVCFAFALLSEHFGYSVALGAFIAGVLIGESGRRRAIERQIAPLRDLFAAVFFVSIGMLVHPAALIDHWGIIAVLTIVVLAGQTLFIALGMLLAGNGIRLSVTTGMSLAQIGEFSFIIVGVGVAAGVVSPDLRAVAVGVALITTFLTPLMIRKSQGVSLGVERRLPHRIQMFISLYGTWFESLRGRGAPATKMQRLWALFVADASLLLALVLAAAVSRDWLAGRLEDQLALSHALASVLVLAAAVALSLPFAVGIVRIARRLGVELATRALPDAGRSLVTTAAAPRRAFFVVMQLALVLLVAFPVVALSQPFLPLYYGIVVLAAIAIALGVRFWRTATNLQEHVHAGAEVILAVLRKQRYSEEAGEEAAIAELLPGLGPLFTLQVKKESAAAGKTLAEMNLRGLTGATVMCIQRSSGGVVAPTGKETLRSGDLVSITGNRDALAAALALLEKPSATQAGEIEDRDASRRATP